AVKRDELEALLGRQEPTQPLHPREPRERRPGHGQVAERPAPARELIYERAHAVSGWTREHDMAVAGAVPGIVVVKVGLVADLERLYVPAPDAAEERARLGGGDPRFPRRK